MGGNNPNGSPCVSLAEHNQSETKHNKVVDEEKTETIVVTDEEDDDVATFRSCEV
jgi:hypothetical protein